MNDDDGDMDTVEGVLNQIVKMVNCFENKKLPDVAVGAIEGWCQRVLWVVYENEDR